MSIFLPLPYKYRVHHVKISEFHYLTLPSIQAIPNNCIDFKMLFFRVLVNVKDICRTALKI